MYINFVAKFFGYSVEYPSINTRPAPGYIYSPYQTQISNFGFIRGFRIYRGLLVMILQRIRRRCPGQEQRQPSSLQSRSGSKGFITPAVEAENMQ